MPLCLVPPAPCKDGWVFSSFLAFFHRFAIFLRFFAMLCDFYSFLCAFRVLAFRADFRAQGFFRPVPGAGAGRGPAG